MAIPPSGLTPALRGFGDSTPHPSRDISQPTQSPGNHVVLTEHLVPRRRRNPGQLDGIT